MNIHNPQELADLLIQSSSLTDEKKKPENLRYVIYARKSTDESSDKQLRSISDQIAECQQMAKNRGLNVVGVVKESESAKEPDIRPKFRQMIEDIKGEKYDGIIAWHPDRLARNMKDAGEIIDLIDKSIIGHMEFVNFTFSNDTSGKMLLGMTFVLSKQYSDNLSDNVKRGMRRSIEEGKFLGRKKHGYVKDKNQYLYPDGERFTLIKEAFNLRAKGETLENIASFLNDNNYMDRSKDSDKKKLFKWNKQRVAEILSDPFYCGVLTFGDTIVNLVEVYSFTPLIETSLFCEINKIKNLTLKLKKARKTNVRADLLRGKVICKSCKTPRDAGLSSKKLKDGTKKWLFYYTCRTKKCEYYGKGIRANKIVEYATEFLEKNNFALREVYDYLVKESSKEIEKQERFTTSQIRSLSQNKNRLEQSIENTKNLLENEDDETLKRSFKDDLKQKIGELEKTQNELQELKTIKNQKKEAIFDFQEFLELWQKLPSTLPKIKNMKTLDQVLQKIFSNFSIEGKKVTSSTLKTPFKEIQERRKKIDCPKWSG